MRKMKAVGACSDLSEAIPPDMHAELVFTTSSETLGRYSMALRYDNDSGFSAGIMSGLNVGEIRVASLLEKLELALRSKTRWDPRFIPTLMYELQFIRLRSILQSYTVFSRDIRIF